MTTTIPAGWKLLAKKTCYVLMHDGAVIATLAGPESKENAAIIARMLAPPSCPTCNDQGAVGNILTAQPCPDCAAPGVSTMEDAQAGETLATSIFGERIGKMLDGNAPAAGDELDAARYRWLRDESLGVPDGMREIYVIQQRLPHTEGTDTELFDTALDAAVDAAIAAQRKGDA